MSTQETTLEMKICAAANWLRGFYNNGVLPSGVPVKHLEDLLAQDTSDVDADMLSDARELLIRMDRWIRGYWDKDRVTFSIRQPQRKR